MRIARDSFTYLHLPMVAGIILFALGAKKTLAHIGDELDAVPAVALCGGVALYLVALSAFKRRNIGSWNWPRLVAASSLAVLAPIATAIPALLALALVAAIGLALWGTRPSPTRTTATGCATGSRPLRWRARARTHHRGEAAWPGRRSSAP